MSQVILVLEENIEIQKVISSSLKDTEILIEDESNPELFLERIRDVKPDLILISNTDSVNDYKICREIKNDTSLVKVPIILLFNAKDNIEEGFLSELGINGILKKPFEASMLKDQLSQFFNIDENFGNGPSQDENDFKIDMKEIDDELKEIKHAESFPKESTEKIKKRLLESPPEKGFTNTKAVGMDSILLENVSKIEGLQKGDNDTDEISGEAKRSSENLHLEEVKDRNIEKNLVEKKEEEIDMESGFEFDLELDEEESEEISEFSSIEKKSSVDGLEELKNSGLEDQYAESLLYDQKDETVQELRAGLEDIELEVNDFEDQRESWERPDDIDLYHKTPREGLADISLDKSDFDPEFPKNLSSFGDNNDLPLEKLDEINKNANEILDAMDNIELEEDLIQNLERENGDNLILTDSVDRRKQSIMKSENFKESELDNAIEEEGFREVGVDTEIKSMVQDSFNVEENFNVTGIDELEELSTQMSELESEEEIEAELESDIELEESEEEIEAELESDTELEESEEPGDLGIELEESEELGDLGIELEESEELGDLDIELEESEESEDLDIELEESEESGDLGIELEESEESEDLGLNEDVFETWDDAENAFLSFDRESSMHDSKPENLEEAEGYFEKGDTYSFTEEELKEIVSSSVQKALEKSIASSLVELAVSELKTKVTEIDQDWV